MALFGRNKVEMQTSADQQALERYRYMLRTAPPETIEQAGASPQALARVATRAEMRQPGSTERMFGQAGGMSMGGMMAGSLMSSIAGAVIGSMIARQFFSSPDHSAAADSAQDWNAADQDQALGDGDAFGDMGGGDIGGGFDV